jgi:hypothetical protein
MSDSRILFTEEAITGAVKKLLTGRVNELLEKLQFNILLIELSNYSGDTVIQPAIVLSTCERSEKERLVLLDSYTLTITFSLVNDDDCDLFRYAYADTVNKAITEDVTLGGIAERTVLTGKKYGDPKKSVYGEKAEVILAYRVTVDGRTENG